jgi:hypothetical protein
MAWGRDRLDRSSLVRKQVKKQPIALDKKRFIKKPQNRSQNQIQLHASAMHTSHATVLYISIIFFFFSIFMQKPLWFYLFICSFFLVLFNQWERERVAGSFLNFETNQTRERFCTLKMKTFRVLPYLRGKQIMTLLAFRSWHVGGFRYFGWCNYGGVPERDSFYERRASLISKVESRGMISWMAMCVVAGLIPFEE